MTQIIYQVRLIITALSNDPHVKFVVRECDISISISCNLGIINLQSLCTLLVVMYMFSLGIPAIPDMHCI